ncbi:MAG: threonine synthase [Clostridiales bacterium]|jgi:threonine synthase|nr:threonine synthase [Clostridiales bacterium]
MHFISTRGEGKISPSQALLKGIADDGGLYVPEFFPDLTDFINNMYRLSYKELAFEILSRFLTDFTEDELKMCIESAYGNNFDTPEVTPLKQAGKYYFLELFHGKTLAFKDMALSILPHLMVTAAKRNKTDKKIIILTATSGDTGKAALEGFANTEGISIAVFYPQNGVSDIQKLQMITQEGENTFAAGVYGNFDDTQTGVKKLFTDAALKQKIADMGFVFSSANSINIGRLLPQIIYYFRAYQQMVNGGEIKHGEKINFTVPTGNFGNILAGYYAKKMGLPVNKLICASNENKILYDFFASGEYNTNRDFYCTVSPSMDILISSNLERLLYDLSNADLVTKTMNALKNQKEYSFEYKADGFCGFFADSAEALKAIGEMFENGYLMDTHTAVGYAAYKKYVKETHDDAKNVIISTASPFKFSADVLRGLGCAKIPEGFASVYELSDKTGLPIPEPIKNLEKKEIKHKTVCGKEEMEKVVLDFINKR